MSKRLVIMPPAFMQAELLRIWDTHRFSGLIPFEKKYVEEVGTSNIFFLLGEELITPPLAGSILPGVTRKSVIALALICKPKLWKGQYLLMKL